MFCNLKIYHLTIFNYFNLLSGNIIDAALWEDYGTKLMTYMSSNGIKEPTIVIITHAFCKQNSSIFSSFFIPFELTNYYYQSVLFVAFVNSILASGKPSISNGLSGSRLHINLDHPQVIQFKSK